MCMAFKFNLEGTTVVDSKILSGISGSIDSLTDDADIVIKGGNLINSELFSNLDIPEFCSKVGSCQETLQMSEEENASLQRILKQRGNRKAFTEALCKHLASFAEGVVASVVATYISK